jgi:signal transduction histidine kinase/DNA-binding response OmpR family regulator
MRQIFGRLSISNKIATVFLILLFMMGVGGMVGLYNATQIASVTRRLYVESFKRSEVLSSVENEVLSARQELFLHAIIADEASKSYLEGTIDEHRDRIEKLLREYKSMGVSARNEALLSELYTSLTNFWYLHKRIEVHSRTGQREAALALLRMDGNKSFRDAISAIRRVVKVEKDIAYSAYKESDFLAGVIIIVTIAFTILGIVFGGALWFILTRSLVRPIVSIEDSARRIGSGDLSHRAVVDSEDEIGSLAGEFNRMAKSLEESYSTLEEKVKARTDELMFAMEELSSKKQELEAANIGLKEANRMKSQFLANVSHELRTPLNSIIGFSELLQERAFGELNERQRQYVDYIRSSGGHLLQLINNILDLSKIEAGRMELAVEDFSVTEALGEVLGIIRPLALKKNISIETKSLPASPLVRADRAKFKQIMINLLSNSVKFNVENGSIYVDWNVKEETRGMRVERYLVFSIIDTGIGIKDEDKGKLFKEFEQIDSSMTREYEGTGLGLVLTKRLVELHNGEIWFSSETAKGTTFFVKLPQGTDELDMPVFTDTLYAREGEMRKPLVLLGCEGQDINQLIAIYLSGELYDVSTAFDGYELIRKAHELKPFAIIMGITIPKMDGWEVIKSLKSDAETRDMPVVIISSIDNRELGMRLGAVDYLEKPVNRDRLLNVLERLKYPAHKKAQKRVLLADSDLDSLNDKGEFLEKQGYLVFKTGPKDGIMEIARDTEPDIIAVCLSPGASMEPALLKALSEFSADKRAKVMVFSSGGGVQAGEGADRDGIRVFNYDGAVSNEQLLSEIRFYLNSAKDSGGI